MMPGVAGTGFTVTLSVCAAELPQELFTFTVMFPLIAEAVALIELVVDAPVHPEGRVQV